jgi:hypothetical protein
MATLFSWISEIDAGAWLLILLFAWFGLILYCITWKKYVQILWTGALTIPTLPPDLLPEERVERLSFLRSFESIRGEVRGRGKILSFLKRVWEVRHQGVRA